MLRTKVQNTIWRSNKQTWSDASFHYQESTGWDMCIVSIYAYRSTCFYLRSRCIVVTWRPLMPRGRFKGTGNHRSLKPLAELRGGMSYDPQLFEELKAMWGTKDARTLPAGSRRGLGWKVWVSF